MKVMFRTLWLALAVVAMALPASLQAAASAKIEGVTKSMHPQVTISLADGKMMIVDFYGENIFRLWCDPSGAAMHDPVAKPEAQILVDNPRKPASVQVKEVGNKSVLTTKRVEITIDEQGVLTVKDLQSGRLVIEQLAPATIEKNYAGMTLKASPTDYFYGGGMQNGRFSHKGKIIQAVNSNNWVDGGVASPAPFYWSTGGYAVMGHTFKPGRYDFCASKAGEVVLSHEEDYLDLFFMVDQKPLALLNDYYQLTGNPVLLPKFGFYEGHLNVYNRDYWKEVKEGGVLFEDGKRYQESQKDNGGIKESLNGEKDNYQFSARAVVDRYKAFDMPLGWVLPNDGYGAGYGQTGSIDGNIQNLKEFGDYARQNGVEIGLWTQSDLHPKEGVEPLLQRDIVKEVGTAGVRVLKTDVAWVGAGYSFGLNGVADVADIMPQYGNQARPFIITLDGWAGTQRYAGLWSGDQTGGNWEYIRFHIPTYIGSGLSGQPNVSSDMDGIFGGKNIPVNVRDFEWKTFTPMELNMDGWGSNEKYPQALGEPATSINRMYLKMKAILMPYTYTVAREAVNGNPICAAMFLDYPNDYTHGKATQYQYMYGPYFLIAPIYQATKADAEGNDIRNGIYLPEGQWIDYFNGQVYEGGRIINEFDAPLWKLPVFVKAGAIIPVTHAHNNVNEMDKNLRVYEFYPHGETSFVEYDDDGVTNAYLAGESATTVITSKVADGKAILTVDPMRGQFKGMETNKVTEMNINVSREPKKVWATVNGKKLKLKKVSDMATLAKTPNAYCYQAAPDLNQFATAGSEMAKVKMVKNPVISVRLASQDVTATTTQVVVEGFYFDMSDKLKTHHGQLAKPILVPADEAVTAYTITPRWMKVDGADYYEVDFQGQTYSTIRSTELLFEDLVPETEYTFDVRAVNADGRSEATRYTVTTKSNPLEFAIPGIKAETTCENQGGQGINRLFDYDETNIWHTKWGQSAVPFDIVMDMRSINTLDKLQYMPREDGGNGTLLKGEVYGSLDKKEWIPLGEFDWKANGEVKEVKFTGNPILQYLKVHVEKAVGNFGSGREMYVFKVPGTETILPGDINHDGKIDMGDFTSYMNYTGLRTGDSDFDGYVSGGDVNGNGLIDAYDISVVGTQVRGGVDLYMMGTLKGELKLTPNKTSYAAGEEVEILVSGVGLEAVNALSFALPYKPSELEYKSIDLLGMKDMENLTYDRLHTNGKKALYPTFVNTGDKDVLLGDTELFRLHFVAKKAVKFNLKMVDGMFVDKALNTLELK